VIGITYEAYKPMAIRVIQEIICEGREAHSLFAVEVIHRVGYLEPGEISIRVSLSAAHRDACYLASAYIMGQLKARAPIWKLEHFEDGTRSWEGCKCARQWDPPPTFP
jgi:molybdopterin synthase catalytic subunit